jgi:3-polyprenyl-4-hydroxybenzoate decarboxylase
MNVNSSAKSSSSMEWGTTRKDSQKLDSRFSKEWQKSASDKAAAVWNKAQDGSKAPPYQRSYSQYQQNYRTTNNPNLEGFPKIWP